MLNEAFGENIALELVKLNQLTEDKVIFKDREHKAKSLVYGIAKSMSDTPVTFSIEDVLLVWFSKTLQNWKALVITTLPGSYYYEVTYNGNKEETYVDVYKKIENVRFPD